PHARCRSLKCCVVLVRQCRAGRLFWLATWYSQVVRLTVNPSLILAERRPLDDGQNFSVCHSSGVDLDVIDDATKVEPHRVAPSSHKDSFARRSLPSGHQTNE